MGEMRALLDRTSVTVYESLVPMVINARDFPQSPFWSVFERICAPYWLPKSFVDAFFRSDGKPIRDLSLKGVERPAGLHYLELEHFLAGWYGVAQRFEAVAHHDDEFGTLVASSEPRIKGSDPIDRAVFGFFTNATATFESLAYAVHAIGAMATPSRFPLRTPKDARNVSFARTLAQVRLAYPRSILAGRLGAVSEDATFKSIGAIRNLLLHRASPPLTDRYELDPQGEPKWLPTTWATASFLGKNLVVGPELTSAPRQWLVEALTGLVEALDELVGGHPKFRTGETSSTRP